MKTQRIVSFFLAVLMVVSCIQFSDLIVNASDTTKNATIKVEKETATAGSAVTLAVSIQVTFEVKETAEAGKSFPVKLSYDFGAMSKMPILVGRL